MKIINIKDKNEALEILEHFKKREQKGAEIRITNVHLCRINTLVKAKIFFKNDLYVNGETLFDIMQPIGGKGKHNHHGLDENIVLSVLNNAYQPIGIYTTNKRYVIATIIINNTNEHLVLVVEKGAQLRNNRNANINKLITIYPRRNILEVISRKKGKIIK